MNFAKMLMSVPVAPKKEENSKYKKMVNASIAARKVRRNERFKAVFNGRELTTPEVAKAAGSEFIRSTLEQMMIEGVVERVGFKPNSTGKRQVAIWRFKEC